MSAPAEASHADSSGGAAGRRRTPAAVAIAAAAFLAASLLLTWWRLFRGADLVDEAFSVLVPWRWALGDRPFVDEQNLSQSAGLVSYPFVKLYALLGGDDVSGLVLYDRHLYLALCLLVAVCVFLLARRSLPAALAALVVAPFVTVVLFDTPQLTANSLCALLLAIAAALTAVAVLGGSRWAALPAGVAFGLAGVAYPTVLLLAPFVAVCLAFSAGDRLVLLLARETSVIPETGASGRVAWRLLSAWALGGAAVVAPVVVTVVVIAGPANLRRSWDYTITLARHLDQLGGTSKAGEIAIAFLSLLGHQWFLVVVAVASLLVYRATPRVGRWLLLLTPPAVALTGSLSGLGVAGSVIMYGLAAPYLYVFVPQARKADGARLLLCAWAPAVLVGAMTAYTSADGLVRAAVGLLSGVVVSGLFLAWGLEPLGSKKAVAWVPAAGLAAVVVATLAFQFVPGESGVPWNDLTARMGAGPWSGIALTGGQKALLDGYAADLARVSGPEDSLLAYPQASAFYLYWPGDVAANTYQLYVDDAPDPLPKATVSYYRRHREVPTLVVHLISTAGKSAPELRDECGGLEYPTVLTGPGRAFNRKPPGESTREVLARLPRL